MTSHTKEDWMNSKWRPAMGWMYMIVCVTDFIIFPILWSVLQAINHGSVTTQWDPITLKGAGLFHMAMGAIVGVTAWSRGQEKLGGVINGGTTTNISSSGSATFSVPSTNNISSTNAYPSSSLGATTASGKLIVPQEPQPLI